MTTQQVETSRTNRTLAERRRLAGLTQQQLADRAGLSIATIRDLEQGLRARVRGKTLRTLCAILDCDGFSDIDLRSA